MVVKFYPHASHSVGELLALDGAQPFTRILAIR